MRLLLVAALVLALPAVFAARQACTGANVDAAFHGRVQSSWAALADETEFNRARIAHVAASVAAAPVSTARGAVFTVASLEDAPAVVTAVMHLRSVSAMPIEVFHASALSAAAVADLEAVSNVAIHNIARGEASLATRAMLASSFGEMVVMDARTVALADPSSLFESAEYTATGALFFPSVYGPSAASPVWAMLGKACEGEVEQSAAVAVLNRAKAWKALNVAAHLSTAAYRSVVNGNSDVLRLAAIATETAFATSSVAARTAGAEYVIAGERRFCAHLTVHAVNGVDMFVASENALVAPAKASVESMNCIAGAAASSDEAVLAAVVAVQAALPEGTNSARLQACTGGSLTYAQAAVLANGRWLSKKVDVSASVVGATFDVVFNGKYDSVLKPLGGEPKCASTFTCIPSSLQSSQVYVFAFNVTAGLARSANIEVETRSAKNGGYGNRTYIYFVNTDTVTKCDYSLLGGENYLYGDIAYGKSGLVYVAWDAANVDRTADLTVTVTYRGAANSAVASLPSVVVLAFAALAAFAARLF